MRFTLRVPHWIGSCLILPYVGITLFSSSELWEGECDSRGEAVARFEFVELAGPIPEPLVGENAAGMVGGPTLRLDKGEGLFGSEVHVSVLADDDG